MTSHDDGSAVLDGRLNVGPFALPRSEFLSAQTKSELQKWTSWIEGSGPAPGHWLDPSAIPALRAFYAKHFAVPIRRLREVYDVRIESGTVAGVHVETFVPANGVPHANEDRLLLNLHGGGFTMGSRYGGQLEAIPICATAKMKVVTIDYRMAPEHRFPAATDDAVAVYRRFVDEYDPRSIGIYGCSAGALLTTQVIARLQAESDSLPAVIGLLCGAGAYWGQGDSAHFMAAMGGDRIRSLGEHPYFRDVVASDPLVSPSGCKETLSGFPPTLLASTTRDHALSSVVDMHSRLIASGRKADLHVWEGLDHAFFYNADLPQSRELYDVVSRFFATHLR